MIPRLLVLASVSAFAQLPGGDFLGYPNPGDLGLALCSSPNLRSQLPAARASLQSSLQTLQRRLPGLRAAEQAANASFDAAIANYRRAFNGDETPTPEELRLGATARMLVSGLDSYYSLVNNRAMWLNSITTLRNLRARFDTEGRTIADLEQYIANIDRDLRLWANAYGTFESTYSRLLQLEDQLAAARAQRGAPDVKALRRSRDQAELAFETAKSKRRDAESEIESIEARLLQLNALPAAAPNCPPQPPTPQPPVRDASTLNLVSRGRCGTTQSFPTNDYSDTTFQLKLPPSGAGPISGHFTQNTADPLSRPIPLGPQNSISGSTNGNSASGTWTLSGTTGTWSGTFHRNSTGEWETAGVFCNRVHETAGCVFRWASPQIAPPIVNLSDLTRCIQ